MVKKSTPSATVYDRIEMHFDSASAVARQLGISRQAWHSFKQLDAVPAKYCYPLEHLTRGQVKAKEIRPDIFDKQYAVRRVLG